MREIEVFADVSCPFTYVGLSRFTALRGERGLAEPILRVRAWPLEVVNGSPVDADTLVPEIEALRRDVVPELFAGFDPATVPDSTLPALAAAAAAYRAGSAQGERFSLRVRHAFFEEGAAIGDPTVVRDLLDELELPHPTDADQRSAHDDHAEGVRRGVTGSPHYFTGDGDFFCPSLDITHDDNGFQVDFDAAGFDAFVASALDQEPR